MARRNVKSAAAALAVTRRPAQPSRWALDAMVNLAAGLGTSRDKRMYTQFTPTQPLDRVQLESMYRDVWLAKKIVTIPVDDMLRNWVELSWENHEENHDDTDMVKDLTKRLDVRAKVRDACYWARLYGGCVIVLGIGNDKLNTPLNLESVRKDSLRYLHVVDRWRAGWTGQIDKDLNSPNFGKPLMYRLAESAVDVHWTRVVRFDGQLLPYFLWRSNGMWHDSVLQHVVNEVKNHDTVSGAMASMVFDANVDVLKAAGLAKNLSMAGGKEKVEGRYMSLGLMKSIHRMMVIDKDVEDYDRKPFQFSGLDRVAQTFMMTVSGAADIPATRLFGKAPDGMNATGDSDDANYRTKLSSMQDTELRGPLEYLMEVLTRSALGYLPDGFTMDYPPLKVLTDKEKADTDKTRADTLNVYYQAGAITAALMARDAKERNLIPSMEDEDVQAVEEMEASAAENDDLMEAAKREALKAKGPLQPGAQPGLPPGKVPAAPPTGLDKPEDPESPR